MKKLLSIVLMIAIVLSVCAVTAFAAGSGGRRFTDADGDGVCDNASDCAYLDANGDRICGNAGSCAYVDADGDGVCGNYASGQACGSHGSGHHGHGHGCGR